MMPDTAPSTVLAFEELVDCLYDEWAEPGLSCSDEDVVKGLIRETLRKWGRAHMAARLN